MTIRRFFYLELPESKRVRYVAGAAMFDYAERTLRIL